MRDVDEQSLKKKIQINFTVDTSLRQEKKIHF